MDSIHVTDPIKISILFHDGFDDDDMSIFF